jgi:hypothetical protein
MLACREQVGPIFRLSENRNAGLRRHRSMGARHVIIEERRWLTEKEFAAILGVGQILPGPNT